MYVKVWVTCPNTYDAPFNDLHLIQALRDYSKTSKVISTTALKVLGRHLWYSGEEMVPLYFFSASEGKRSIRYNKVSDMELHNKTLHSLLD